MHKRENEVVEVVTVLPPKVKGPGFDSYVAHLFAKIRRAKALVVGRGPQHVESCEPCWAGDGR